MNLVAVMVKKEIKELISSKSTLTVGLGFAIFFSITYALDFTKGEGIAAVTSLDSSVFYLSVSVAVFITFTFISQVFVREKAERVIETLMCAPVDLRQIWLGKALGIAIPSYLITLLSVSLIVVISSLVSQSIRLPSLATMVHVLLGVPTLIIAFGGLVGFGQLLLGMRENRLLNLLIFVPAFGAIYGSGYMVARNSAITWQHVGIIFAVCAFFVVVTAYVARYLSKERIVTAIS